MSKSSAIAGRIGRVFSWIVVILVSLIILTGLVSLSAKIYIALETLQGTLSCIFGVLSGIFVVGCCFIAAILCEIAVKMGKLVDAVDRLHELEVERGRER